MSTITAPRKESGGKGRAGAALLLGVMALTVALLLVNQVSRTSSPSAPTPSTQKVVILIDDDPFVIESALQTWTMLTGITQVIPFSTCEAALAYPGLAAAYAVLIDGRMYKDSGAGPKCMRAILAMYPSLTGRVWGYSTEPDIFENEKLPWIGKDLNALRALFPK